MIHIFAIHKQKIAKENPAAGDRHGVGKGICSFGRLAAVFQFVLHDFLPFIHVIRRRRAKIRVRF